MIRERIEDGILIAEFCNGKYNTITTETLIQLRDAIAKVNTDKSLKGMILTGAGRIFCSGFDIPNFLSFKNLDEAVKFFEDYAEPVFMDYFMCKKPTVAAINGAPIAGGMILATASDYRIVKNHPKIQLGMSEIKIGLGLSIVQTEIMRFGLDGDRAYRNVMFNGERYGVEKALEVGLVDELAEEANLLTRAKQVVAGWWDNPGHSFSLLKESLRRPAYDRMKYYLANASWQQGFNCMFDPETRGALEFVQKMMV
jgi:enoyl-CoA hydratase/carnithine racemase